MEKILNAFKNLYKGVNVVKTHICIALLFIIPALLGATVQFLDKDFKEYMIPVLIASLILTVLSIVPVLFLSGYYLKFLNKRLSEPVGIPELNLDSFIKGVKALPVFLVWLLYIGIPVSIVFFVICIFGLFLLSNKDLLSIVLLILLFFVFIAIISIYSIIVSPFVQFVYISYAKNFEYSAKIFNPLVFFSYMKIAFKESILVSLKFIVVNFVISAISQVIITVFILLGISIGTLFQLGSNSTTEALAPAAIVCIILFSSLAGIVHCYLVQMSTLAYADNLMDVYKTKIEEISIPEKISSSEDAKNNEKQANENEHNSENEG